MRYSYENSYCSTRSPSFLRRQESIFGAPPSDPQETERPTSFSFQVVRVATLMRYSERSEESKIHNHKTRQTAQEPLSRKCRPLLPFAGEGWDEGKYLPLSQTNA